MVSVAKPTFADIDSDGDLDAFVGDGDGNISYFENAPVVSIAAGTTPAEGGATGTFTLTLDTPAPDGFSVNYTIAGTATAGTDYTALSGTVAFNPGETTATINVTATDDTVIEPGETVIITLTDAASYNVAASPNNTATLTIDDNDIEYAIVANNPTVTEGNTGVTPITYTITRTGRTDVSSTVDYTLAGTATNGTDYNNIVVSGTNVTAAGSTITFAAGATTATVTIDVVGDAVAETNETLDVTLSNPTAAGYSATIPVVTPVTTTITDDDPEIEVLDGTTNIADGTTTALDFGSTILGTALTKTFTINNTGTAALNLSALTLPTGFSIVGALPATIAAGGTSNLTVKLDATAVGNSTGNLQFTNNDGDENPFNFAISGTVTAVPAPEIQVLNGATNIADGTTTALDFGSTVLGTAVTKTFTIKNTGSAALNLSALILPTGFSVVGALPSAIAAGGTSNLTVKLDATAVGNSTGNLQFTNNDADENPFNFTISGNVTATPSPEIQVLDGATDIADGTTTALNFGSVKVGTSLTKAFTIQNIGSTILQLGNLTLPTGFSIVGNAPTTVAAGAKATLTIQVDTTSAGTKNGTLSFINSDSNENPFNFAIAATVTATPTPTPEPTPTPTPEPTPTPTPEPTPTPTPEPTPTPTPEPTPTPTPAATDEGCLCEIFPTPDLGKIAIAPNKIAETLQGTEGDDLVIGDATAEAFNVKGGNDLVAGFGGNDNLYGGASADLLFGNSGNDYINGGAQNDLIFAGKDNDAVNGGADNDTVLGDIGKDTLLGGDGNDWLFGNTGTDTIDGEGGDDIIFGGKGNDALLGNIGNDIVVGDLGDDLVKGSDGNDLLFGNVGKDFIAGGAGIDTIFAGQDNDIAKGGEDNDIVVGDKGNDSICGGEGNDLLYGNTGNDSMDGCEGDDLLYGGKDNDTLIGNKGNDVLWGEMGNDSLVGGTGSDRFVLSNVAGSDMIADFEDGTDKIVLAGGLTFEQLSISSNGSATTISLTSNGELLASLNGVSSNLITAEDFVLI